MHVSMCTYVYARMQMYRQICTCTFHRLMHTQSFIHETLLIYIFTMTKLIFHSFFLVKCIFAVTIPYSNSNNFPCLANFTWNGTVTGDYMYQVWIMPSYKQNSYFCIILHVSLSGKQKMSNGFSSTFKLIWFSSYILILTLWILPNIYHKIMYFFFLTSILSSSLHIFLFLKKKEKFPTKTTRTDYWKAFHHKLGKNQ